MLAIIALHDRVGTYRLPGGLYEIAPYQTMRPWRYAQGPIIAPTLMDPGCKTDIARQMFYTVEAPEIAQFTQYTAGHDTSYSRYAPEQHIIFLMMGLAISPELGRYIPEFLVHETEEAHTAIQSRFCRRVLEYHIVQPVPILMAPMIVIEFLGFLDTEIQQLHFYVTLDPTEILDQIVATTEKAPQFFPIDIGYMNAFQATVLKFPGNQLRIDLIGLGMFLIAFPVDIGRVDHQRIPAV